MATSALLYKHSPGGCTIELPSAGHIVSPLDILSELWQSEIF